jgi:hypothetical protein
LVILQQLADQNKKLAIQFASLVLAYLSDVDSEEIAETLHHELESLIPGEVVWDRAGKTRFSYVETGEGG